MSASRWCRLLPAGLMWLALCLPAAAVLPDEVLADSALEMRARALSKDLRCMVCQNQSIDDSDAELARDLRVIVRERLLAGDSDAQVIDFVVARYGEFVLLRPRISAHTLLLWGSPALLLAAGAAFVLMRRRQAPETPPALSVEEEARIAALLDGYDKG